MLRLSQIWSVEAPSNWPLTLFDLGTLSFFARFFTFSNNEVFQAHLVLPLPQPWKQPILQRELVLFRGEMLVRNSDMCSRCACCCWDVIPFRPYAGQNFLKNIYLYIWTHPGISNPFPAPQCSCLLFPVPNLWLSFISDNRVPIVLNVFIHLLTPRICWK